MALPLFPVGFVFEGFVVPLGLLHELFGGERQAVRGGMFFGCAGMRDREHQDDVDQDRAAPGQQTERDEDDPDDGDIGAPEGGQAGADSADHRALMNPVQPLRRGPVTCRGALPDPIRCRFRRCIGRPAGPARGRPCSAGCARRRGRFAFDGPHLAQDLRDFLGSDHGLARAEEVIALLGNRLFEVGDDLAAPRIAAQLDLRALQISVQGVVAAFLDLIGVAVETDGDDLAHGY